MFLFEKKFSLRDVFDRYHSVVRSVFIGRYIDTTTTFRRYDDAMAATDEVSCKLSWRFLEFYPESYVLTPSGHFVELDELAWHSPFDIYQPRNGLLNIRSGLLESSEEHSSTQHTAACDEIISPFEGCPVYLAEDEDQLFTADLEVETPFPNLHVRRSSYLEGELNDWFQYRAPSLNISRPPDTEIVYLTGENESPDDVKSYVLSGEDLFSALGELPDQPKLHTPLSSHETIRNYVLEACPDGKGSLSWDRVESKVGYSRRSIVRALKALNQYEEWVGGQTPT